MTEKYQIPFVKFFEYTKIVGIENIEFGKYIIIDDFVFIYAKEKMKIGSYVHIASFSTVSGGASLIMEDFSGLSSGTRIVTASDDFKESGFGNPTIGTKYRNITSGPVIIERFAIIGSNSVILPSVKIGEGATVGAGSVVSKDLEPWGIYIGNKKVGTRDKNAVLSNYESFLAEPEEKRLGSLFRTNNDDRRF